MRCAASNCNRFMFHVEGCNTMYTKTIGLWQQRQGLIKGAKWYFLTADYAFGHDLYRVSSKFLEENGGINLGNDWCRPTPSTTAPTSSRSARRNPDFVYINLAGVDQTTFLKQYKEYGLPIQLAGGVMDTVPFWAAGLESLSGHWQSLWYHGLDNAAAQAFTQKFSRTLRQAARQSGLGRLRRHPDPAQGDRRDQGHRQRGDLIEYLEKGAEFDILKGRKGKFRDWDHQLLQEMYVVKVKDKARIEGPVGHLRGRRAAARPRPDLELIQPTKEENPCSDAREPDRIDGGRALQGRFQPAPTSSQPQSFIRRAGCRLRVPRAHGERPAGRVVLHRAGARPVADLQPRRRGQPRARRVLRARRLFRLRDPAPARLLRRRWSSRRSLVALIGMVIERLFTAPALSRGPGARAAVHLRPRDGVEQSLRLIWGATGLPFPMPEALRGRLLLGDFIYSYYRLTMLAVAAFAVLGMLAAPEQDRVRHDRARRHARS